MGITYNYSAMIDLLSRSENCSSGYRWIWEHVSQCVEETGHLAGFIFGGLSIILSAVAYLSLSIIHVRRTNKNHARSTIVTAVLQWFSELSAFIGAFLSLQLPTQIIYSVVILCIQTICLIYICINQNIKALQNDRKKSFLPWTFFYPCIFILPFLSMINMLTSRPLPKMIGRHDIITERPLPIYETGMTMDFVIGYNLGILAAILLCGARTVEVVHLLRSMDNHRCIPYVYITSIVGGVSYIHGVLSQSLSTPFLFHTLPWTMPRLVIVGMDVGIFTQHLLYTRQGRKRNLSNEDAQTLLSSNEETDFSDDGSEEVIWMPLKTFDFPDPKYEVLRLQIVSESDPIDLNIDNNEGESVNHLGNYIDSKMDKANSDEKIECKDKKSNENVSKLDIDTQAVMSETEHIEDDLQSEIESSSSDSDISKHINTNNNIVKKNIETLAEVSKEEKIVSWMNSK